MNLTKLKLLLLSSNALLLTQTHFTYVYIYLLPFTLPPHRFFHISSESASTTSTTTAIAPAKNKLWVDQIDFHLGIFSVHEQEVGGMVLLRISGEDITNMNPFLI